MSRRCACDRSLRETCLTYGGVDVVVNKPPSYTPRSTKHSQDWNITSNAYRLRATSWSRERFAYEVAGKAGDGSSARKLGLRGARPRVQHVRRRRNCI